MQGTGRWGSKHHSPHPPEGLCSPSLSRSSTPAQPLSSLLHRGQRPRPLLDSSFSLALPPPPLPSNQSPRPLEKRDNWWVLFSTCVSVWRSPNGKLSLTEDKYNFLNWSLLLCYFRARMLITPLPYLRLLPLRSSAPPTAAPSSSQPAFRGVTVLSTPKEEGGRGSSF